MNNMDYAKIAKIIGSKRIIGLGGLSVEVKVLNYKNSYGRDRWKVTPVSGSGEIWVEDIGRTE